MVSVKKREQQLERQEEEKVRMFTAVKFINHASQTSGGDDITG